MGDILDKIENFIDEYENACEVKYISKKDALYILECIKSEIKDDVFLLDPFIESVEKGWTVSNTTLLKSFYRIMEGYGIIGESSERKTVLEQKGKAIVRKFIALKSRDRIRKIIES